IGPFELKRAVRPALELVAFFVDRAVVPATESREIRERRGPTLGPVLAVVPLAEAGTAAGEATSAIPVVERSTDRRRNRSSAGPHLGHAPVRLVTHDNRGPAAAQPRRRSGRNAHAVFELRVPGLIRVSQDGGVDMDYHLVAL